MSLALCLLLVAQLPPAPPPAPPAPAAPSVRVPEGPLPQPAPPPPPAGPLKLTGDALLVVDADVPCTVLVSPAPLAAVAAEKGPLKIKGVFVDGPPGKSVCRTYAGKYVYVVEAAPDAAGAAELLVVYADAAGQTQTVRRALVVGDGPAPAPVPPTPTDPLTRALQAAYDGDKDADRAKSLAFLQAAYKGMAAQAMTQTFATNAQWLAWMKQVVEAPGVGLAAAQLKGLRTAVGAELQSAWGASAAPLAAPAAAQELRKVSDALAGVK